jgi:hypothetical protein
MRKLLITMLTITLLQACDKPGVCGEEEAPKTDAVIWNTGGLEVDGCDWVIETDAGTRYHADNLPASFKESGLNVRVRFDLTGTQFTCGWNHKIPVIHIKSIER